MAELSVPQIDFSSLGQLPQIYKQAQADAVRQQTLANLGNNPNGQIDPTPLIKSGDLTLANLGIQIQNREADQARQAAQDARQAANDTFTHNIQTQQLALSQRAANRADESPLDKVNQRVEVLKANNIDPSSPEGRSYALTGSFPDSYTNPNKVSVLGKGGELYRIGPDGQPLVVHKNTEATEPTIDDDTADLLARRTLQGDTRALVGLGRGAQGPGNILKVQQRVAQIAKEQGIDATDILNNIAVQAGRTSEARTLGSKSANFGVAEKSMEESLPIALAASKKVARTAFPAVNRLIQAGETNVGDPTLKQFLIATDTAAKDYARTINPSGQTREQDIAYARKLLSTADSPEAYEAALTQLQVEAGVTKRAIQRQKDEMQSRGRSESSKSDPLGIR